MQNPYQKTTEFLRFIFNPSDIVRCFVKPNAASGHRGGQGYYDSEHLDKLIADIRQHDGEAAGIFYGLNPPARDCLKRSPNSLGESSSKTSCKNTDITRRHLLLIDIDAVREPDCSATDSEKKAAKEVGVRALKHLSQIGWPKPVIVDSGNGYHLLYRIDLPVDDGGLVRKCLRVLASQFDCPEARIDTAVHDAVRLAKLPGTLVCKGQSSERRPHRRSGLFKLPEQFCAVPRDLLTQLAESGQPKPSATTTGSEESAGNASHQTPAQVVSRARAYLGKMPPAISGQKGRNQCFGAAMRLVDDFGLSREDARALLEEYNTKCKPPFSSREIEDKLESAIAKVTLRGGPSRSKVGVRDSQMPVRTQPRFFGCVPDFGLVAYHYVLMENNRPQHLGRMVSSFCYWNRLSPIALVPDLFLRQLIWGSSYDRNWKARLPCKKACKKLEPVRNRKICSSVNCFLYGTGLRHGHYSDGRTTFPILDNFKIANSADDRDSLRFHLYAPQHKELRESLQRRCVLFRVYWPAYILGGSPKVGWSWPQQRLVCGMVKELTRAKPSAGEPLCGETVKDGMVAATGMASGLVTCPLLNPAAEYVVFGGNGRRKGRGYQIIGRTNLGWLIRVGYPIEIKDFSANGHKLRRELLKPFLNDLSFLSDELGLVPAGILNGAWKDIGQMIDCLRTGNGCDWLEGCILRIYAPADWRKRWRQYFSDKLGFSWIPETLEHYASPAEATAQGSFGSAHEVREWLRKRGWSQKNLAKQIAAVTARPCSVRRVERNLSDKGPSRNFLQDVASVRSAATDTEVT